MKGSNYNGGGYQNGFDYVYDRESETSKEKHPLRYIRENNGFDPDELNKENTSTFPGNEWKLAEMFKSGEVRNAIVKTGVMMGYVMCAKSEDEDFPPVTFEVIDYPEAKVSSCWLLQLDEESDDQKEDIPETVSDLFERMAT